MAAIERGYILSAISPRSSGLARSAANASEIKEDDIDAMLMINVDYIFVVAISYLVS